jgi:hypothetical protein
MDDTMGYIQKKYYFHITFFLSIGYTTTKPDKFKLQDDGSAKAVAALAAVFG